MRLIKDGVFVNVNKFFLIVCSLFLAHSVGAFGSISSTGARLRVDVDTYTVESRARSEWNYGGFDPSRPSYACPAPDRTAVKASREIDVRSAKPRRVGSAKTDRVGRCVSYTPWPPLGPHVIPCGR